MAYCLRRQSIINLITKWIFASSAKRTPLIFTRFLHGQIISRIDLEEHKATGKPLQDAANDGQKILNYTIDGNSLSVI